MKIIKHIVVLKILLFINFSILFSICEDLSEVPCTNYEECIWIENIEIINCDVFENDFICDDYSGCNWHCCGIMWGGQCLGAGYCCDGGSYEVGNGYCEEVNLLIGDFNTDYVVNILDVIILVNHILSPATVELDGSDINNDSIVNILDVIILLNIVLK
tara:strand:- start:30 stop:506 length:477 start_codon:yes stop_codon:yes gene_type:complete